MRAYFIGIDIGTQGARVVLLDEGGSPVHAVSAGFEWTDASRTEQSPLMWWNTCKALLISLAGQASKSINLTDIRAISVTSTSGTIIPLDKQQQPLYPAIMYSDQRSADEARVCASAAREAGTTGFSAFNSSCGLPKMRWFLGLDSANAERLGRFIHAADYIIGQLSGNFGVTDYTNALKSGYDVHQLEWPSYITDKLHFRREWFQEVVPSGTPVGTLLNTLAKETGLPEKIVITAGMTDGCASQVASGAVRRGDWNTTIGTTLVIKGVTTKEILDPSGAIYNHRHPDGYWMPGGASNTGADWISTLFNGQDLDHLNREAAVLIPGRHLAWPLLQTGERFPFVSGSARGFAPDGLSRAELFTAYLEGVAFIEKFAYDKIRKLSGEAIKCVYSAGGGSSSDTWLRIRSNVLNLPIAKMENVTGAAGAAILAASKTFYRHLEEAGTFMTHAEKTLQPDPELVPRYAERYQAFVNLLEHKGYITD